MGFRTWVEDSDRAASAFPASAEVIRTGLQPQIDSQEINTKEKEEHDQLLAIDSHIQRLKLAVDQLRTKGSSKLDRIKNLVSKFSSDWDTVRMGNPIKQEDGFKSPSDGEVEYLKNTQPPPANAVRAI